MGHNEMLVLRLLLAEKALFAYKEVLALRSDFFKDITKHGTEMARHYTFLGGDSSDAVLLETERTQ